ncbi:NAD-dependent epimerase/dehydratase family protein [Numidum massiliense]|uniref:NAD-dependent epimerase/dehydratase family protein n=1 Tax=Numidum massiliense TaxID=1522315 RepID=UPI0006D57E17|nr:NAD-dependent epimerase/dehydratase family protein [Numidum massiliense]
MKVLVLGGTRFFGVRLIKHALDAGHTVVVATTGRSPVPFADRVEHVTVDRHDRASMEAALKGREFDVVYDQVGYSPDDASVACDVFQGRIGRLIFTSSASVYEPQTIPLKEEMFDPRVAPLRHGGKDELTYPEGKRYAEAMYFQQATFPVTAVRFPIVVGEDDYTGRFQFHVERVLHGEEIGIPSKAAKMSFISADEAAAFLHWLGMSELRGPVNAAAHTPLTAQEVVDIVAGVVGKVPVVSDSGADGVRSPYDTPVNFTLNLAKATAHGYRFSSSRDWLPEVTARVLANLHT